jgi:outer membrane protein OmpA-like peptidoglycan-associated protein
MAGHDASQQGIYRRGVILGLSLAEALLILIFVLLIFFAVILVGHAEQTDELRRKAEDLDRKLAAAELLIAKIGLMDPRESPADVDEVVRFVAIVRSLRENYTERQLREMLLSIRLYGSKSEDVPTDFTRVAWAYAAVRAMESNKVNVADIVADPTIVVATQRLVAQGYQREQVRRFAEALPDFGGPAELPQDWKRVAWASRTANQLEQTGVKLGPLAERPAVLVTLQQLLDKGYSPEQIRDLLAAVPLFGTPPELPKDWSRVAWAAQNLDRLERDDVNVRSLAEGPAVFVALQRLLDQGYSQDELRELFAALPQFGRPRNLPKDWSRVASAARAVTSLENAGIDVRSIIADPRPFAALQQSIEKGYTREQLSELLEALPVFGGPTELPKDWARVARARTAFDQLERDGIDTRTLTENRAAIVAVQQALGKGYTREQLRALLDALSVFGPSAQLPQDWARVARAAAMFDQLEKNGIDVKTLVEKSSVIVTVQQLLARGYTREQLRDLLVAVPEFGSPTTLPKDWVQAARDLAAVKRMRDGNVDPDFVAKNPSPFAGFQKTLRDGAQPGPGGPDPRRGTWPPMIPLTEADGYFFPTDSAKLSPAFKAKLRDVVPRILKVMNDFQVDVVEVTGNTDERPIKSKRRQSNMDRMPLAVLRHNADPETMLASDNAGLGLARAIAVARELMSHPQLAGRTIIPLSASYLVDASGRLTQGTDIRDDERRRRIEIRLRRAN